MKRFLRFSLVLCCVGALCAILSGCPLLEETPRTPDPAPDDLKIVFNLKEEERIMQLGQEYPIQATSSSLSYHGYYRDMMWVCEDPEVLDIVPVELNYNYSRAKVVPKAIGITKIYCQSIDGKVKSAQIPIKVIQDEETAAKDLSLCQITKLELAQPDNLWLKNTAETSPSLSVKYSSDFYTDYQYIEWVSTNPDVATITKTWKPSPRSRNMSVTLALTGEGQTQLYAQTKDGSVVSNKITLIIGAHFNKEETAKTDVESYIRSHLLYPTITIRELLGARDPFIFMYKNRRVFQYRDKTYSSSVHCTDLDIQPSGLVTAKGTVSTFTTPDSPATTSFEFKLVLQYDTDWKKYTITSEQYGNPSLMISSVN